MKLTNQDFTNLCEIAICAARKAGSVISGYISKEVTVHNKTGADSLASQVVTEVDVKAQETILDILEESMNSFDLALLTEESIDDKSRLEKDYFWCIDPMDGTLAFTEKTPGFAVSIALVSKKGEPYIGVVFDPTTGNLYHAIKNQGVFKNEVEWKPGLTSQNSGTFLLNVDRSFIQHNKYQQLKTEIESMLPELGLNNIKIQKHAGAVLNAIWTMEKSPGCYFKLPKKNPGGGSIWDFAATTCIFNEAGAFVANAFGSAIELNNPGTTFMNHKGVLFASNHSIADKILATDVFNSL